MLNFYKWIMGLHVCDTIYKLGWQVISLTGIIWIHNFGFTILLFNRTKEGIGYLCNKKHWLDLKYSCLIPYK